MLKRRATVALVLLAFCTDSWGQSPVAPANNPPASKTEQPAAPDERGTDKVPLTVKILPAPDGQEQADKTERDRKEKAVIEEKIAFETQRIADYTDRLTWFTLLLFAAALGQIVLFFVQLRYMGDEMRRSRKAFISVHRPRVIVRYVEGPTFNEEPREIIRVHVANTGESKAIIQEFGADLARRKGTTWLTPGASGEPQAIPPIELISGQRHAFEVAAKTTLSDDDIFMDANDKEEEIRTCAFGTIRYADENGVVRETGFFRTYNNRTERFVPSQDAGEEYQD